MGHILIYYDIFHGAVRREMEARRGIYGGGDDRDLGK